MNKEDRIKEGDIVNININSVAITLVSEGEVLGTPCATGDSWKIRDLKTKRIIYISEPCTITKLIEGNFKSNYDEKDVPF